MNAEKGHLYLVGIGPGAADLLTLRAVGILSTVDVILAPRSATSDDSLALATVRPHLTDAEVVEHIYPMERDNEKTAQSWRKMADLACERIALGQSVAHITLGDPLVYSTCAYLLDQIDGRIPQDHIHVISGISAWQATSALLGEMLMLQNDRMMILPADNLVAVEEAFAHCETMVIYKIGKRFRAVVELLEKHNLVANASLVAYAEQGKQRILRNLAEADDDKLGYMSTMVIHLGRRSWE